MEQAIKRSTEWQRKYREKNPWAKHWMWSKGRAKTKGWEHSLKVADFKKLWLRGNASSLLRPSIDRIDSSKGYVEGNCRFIELSLNSGRENHYSDRTEKQRKASSENLKNYKKLNPTPWNKKA